MQHIRNIIYFLTLYLTITSSSAHAGLFGSTEIKNHDVSHFPKWTQMLERADIEENLCTKQNQCLLQEWTKKLDIYINSGKLSLLNKVNNYVNDVEYIDDKTRWKTTDYWATPGQFLKYGGDCEDYAITKFKLLRKLGFKNDQMRVVVLHNTLLSTIHSVLVVAIENNHYVLDESIPTVMKTSEIKHYRPIYSINETNWWLHS